MRLQPDEDAEFAWTLRETPAARLEFIQTLPDQDLNTFVADGFWPPEADGLDIMKAVLAHPGLSMVSAMAIYCSSNALALGQEEARGEAPEWVRGMDAEIEILQRLRDTLNAMAFADKIYPYQHFSSLLKWVVRVNGPETLGSYALAPQVISYIENAMHDEQKTLAAPALLKAIEESEDQDKLTRLSRAALWIRKQLGLV